MDTSKLIQLALDSGADHAAVLDIDKVTFNEDFRLICKSNACGNYGHCHMCPPEVGEITDLIRRAKQYSRIILFQSIIEMKNTFDYNEQEAASKVHNLRALRLQEKIRELTGDYIVLGPGACPLCKECSARMGLPCRIPDKAFASLESYGFDVNELAKLAGLDALSRPGTITFFGLVLCNL